MTELTDTGDERPGAPTPEPGRSRPKEEPPISGTAVGAADVRDTPYLEPIFDEDDEPPADEPDSWVGRVLSNVYEVEVRIGEGGMGAVYRARHVHLEKPFAIKVLSEAALERSHAVERLKQEAVAASAIDHENIVDVVNFDRTDDGSVFIVMEFLAGESLAEALGRGPVALQRALPITYQLCRALHAAHEHGIVHRDLKPENVFLTDKHGRQLVKVLDFGISKVKRAQAEEVRMTRTGQLVGTPLYMSPEQARGETEIDRRADIYATGVLLYEMITGAPPFEGKNYFELLWKHGNETPPSLRDRNPNVYVPEGLEEVVRRALAKKANDRHPTMEAFAEALRVAVPEVPSLPPLATLPPEQPLGTAVKVTVRRPSSISRRTTEDIERTADALPPRWGSAPAVAMLVGLLLLVSAVVVTALREDPDPAPAPPSAEPAAPAPAIAPVAVEEVASPPPTEVALTLTSEPTRAQVFVGDAEEPAGTTPFTLTVPNDGEAVALTFRLGRYWSPVTVDVVAEPGAEVPTVELQRRRPGRPAPRTGGSGLPIKRGL